MTFVTKIPNFFMFRMNMSWQVIFLIKWFITFVTRITNVSWTDSNGLFNCVPICFVHVWQNWELQYAYLIETFHPLPLLTSSSIATWFSESCTESCSLCRMFIGNQKMNIAEQRYGHNLLTKCISYNNKIHQDHPVIDM